MILSLLLSVTALAVLAYAVYKRFKPVRTIEESEFGAGLVVCLVKFSEHLWSGSAYSERMIHDYHHWMEMTREQRDKRAAEAQRFPHGDASEFLRNVSIFEIGKKIRGSEEAALSSGITMWMNAASDHLYGMDENAPQPMIELRELCLTMGHGFTDQIWTMGDVERVRELWKQSALALDARLRVPHNWGEW